MFPFYVNSFLLGFAVAAAIMLIWHKVCDLQDYLKFRDWCDSKGIDDDDLGKTSMPKYFAMWRLSQLDGIEIVEHKGDDDGKRRED